MRLYAKKSHATPTTCSSLRSISFVVASWRTLALQPRCSRGRVSSQRSNLRLSAGCIRSNENFSRKASECCVLRVSKKQLQKAVCSRNSESGLYMRLALSLFVMAIPFSLNSEYLQFGQSPRRGACNFPCIYNRRRFCRIAVFLDGLASVAR